MKNIFAIITLFILSSCSSNTSNYYLKDFEVKSDLQQETTSEVVFNNIIYSKIMTEQETEKFFGSELEDFTVIFFSVENISDNTSFFKVSDAKIYENKDDFYETIKLSKLIASQKVNFNNSEEYSNPFLETEMENNNFAYNLNKKILNNFALEPKKKKSGFLIFEKAQDPKSLEFFITSGTSIYTARLYKINLDR